MYVGITTSGPARWAQHASEKAWWRDVFTTTVEHYPTRAAAAAAELSAIRSERPLHNIASAPRRDGAHQVRPPVSRRPAGVPATIDFAQLLDSQQVAQAVGLSTGDAVSVYERRYGDFPEPVVVRHSGRCKLWWAPDIQAFLERHPRVGRNRLRPVVTPPA